VSNVPPPLVIDSARVLSYAFVDDIPYRRHGRLYVDGKLLEAVPCLAIVVNLGKDIGPMLFHCDEEWNALGTSGNGSVAAIKDDAEHNYPGVAARWVDINTSVEDALRYYDAQHGSLACDYCGKRPFELNGWIEGRNSIICRVCVEANYHAFQSSEFGAGSNE
jgi:hypothetical protein